MPLAKPYPHVARGEKYPTEYLDKNGDIRVHLAAYELLKRDFRTLLEYIEPTGDNFKTYSHRTYELLLRACTEVETLAKLVFEANQVEIGKDNIARYSDLDGPMRLSQYVVETVDFTYPNFRPYEAFAGPKGNRSPDWYSAYNGVKHHRRERFRQASLGHVLKAIGGVYVLLSAQIGTQFDNRFVYWKMDKNGGVSFVTQGDLFGLVAVPEWADDEKYDFDWDGLKISSEPYQLVEIPPIP